MTTPIPSDSDDDSEFEPSGLTGSLSQKKQPPSLGRKNRKSGGGRRPSVAVHSSHRRKPKASRMQPSKNKNDNDDNGTLFQKASRKAESTPLPAGITSSKQLFWYRRQDGVYFPCRKCEPAEAREVNLEPRWDPAEVSLVQALEFPSGTRPFDGRDRLLVENMELKPYGKADKWDAKLYETYVGQRKADPNRTVSGTNAKAGYMYLQRILRAAIDREVPLLSPGDNNETNGSFSSQEIPYADPESQQSGQLPLPDFSQTKREKLRPGDVIEYFHPIFCAGDPRGLRTAIVLSTNPSEGQESIKLDSGDILPADHRIKRIKILEDGKLRRHRSKYRSIENFRMKERGLSDKELSNIKTMTDRVNEVIDKNLTKLKEDIAKEGGPVDLVSFGPRTTKRPPHRPQKKVVSKPPEHEESTSSDDSMIIVPSKLPQLHFSQLDDPLSQPLPQTKPVCSEKVNQGTSKRKHKSNRLLRPAQKNQKEARAKHKSTTGVPLKKDGGSDSSLCKESQSIKSITRSLRKRRRSNLRRTSSKRNGSEKTSLTCTFVKSSLSHNTNQTAANEFDTSLESNGKDLVIQKQASCISLVADDPEGGSDSDSDLELLPFVRNQQRLSKGNQEDRTSTSHRQKGTKSIKKPTRFSNTTMRVVGNPRSKYRDQYDNISGASADADLGAVDSDDPLHRAGVMEKQPIRLVGTSDSDVSDDCSFKERNVGEHKSIGSSVWPNIMDQNMSGRTLKDAARGNGASDRTKLRVTNGRVRRVKLKQRKPRDISKRTVIDVDLLPEIGEPTDLNEHLVAAAEDQSIKSLHQNDTDAGFSDRKKPPVEDIDDSDGSDVPRGRAQLAKEHSTPVCHGDRSGKHRDRVKETGFSFTKQNSKPPTEPKQDQRRSSKGSPSHHPSPRYINVLNRRIVSIFEKNSVMSEDEFSNFSAQSVGLVPAQVNRKRVVSEPIKEEESSDWMSSPEKAEPMVSRPHEIVFARSDLMGRFEGGNVANRSVARNRSSPYDRLRNFRPNDPFWDEVNYDEDTAEKCSRDKENHISHQQMGWTSSDESQRDSNLTGGQESKIPRSRGLPHRRGQTGGYRRDADCNSPALEPMIDELEDSSEDEKYKFAARKVGRSTKQRRRKSFSRRERSLITTPTRLDSQMDIWYS